MNSIKKYLAEFLGTFALVLVGAGTLCHFNESIVSPAVFGMICVSLAHGLTFATMFYAFGHISWVQMNPAITVAMFATGKIKAIDAAINILAQLIGAASAGFLLKTMFVPAGTGFLGATDLGHSVTQGMGVLYEAVGTFLFFTVIFGAIGEDKPSGNLAGLTIGLSLTSLIFLFGPLTGASFNPARTFGPALASGHWNHFWIYLTGPIVGGTAAGFLQTRVFNKPSSQS